jgi:Lrp/AsnC family transcriptional regulator of ectoine degradation
MIALDDRDLRILSILQTEGRIAKTALAKRVNLSPTPCWERLKRLEDAGVIEGYGARVSLKALGPLSVIFMEAELTSHRAEDFARFETAVAATPEIVECWAVGGGIDYMLKFVCADIDAYQRLVDAMLSDDIGLRRYFTYVVTKPVKTAPCPPISDQKTFRI